MVRATTATNAKTTTTLSYDNAAWTDLLTAVKIGSTSKTITYPTDGNGNVTAGTPRTWYNGSDYRLTWKKGTQLASAEKGLVTTFRYAMVPYILAENPQLTAAQVIELSKQMMDGKKGDSRVGNMKKVKSILQAIKKLLRAPFEFDESADTFQLKYILRGPLD